MARLVGKMAPSSDASDHLKLLELKLSKEVFDRVASLLTGGDRVALLRDFTFDAIINDERMNKDPGLKRIVATLGQRNRVFLTNGVLDAHLSIPGKQKCVPIKGSRHLQARIGAYSQEAFTGAPLRVVHGKIHPSTVGLKPSIWQSTASGTAFPTKGGLVSTSSQLPIWAAAMFNQVSSILEQPYTTLNPAGLVKDLIIVHGPFRTEKWKKHEKRRQEAGVSGRHKKRKRRRLADNEKQNEQQTHIATDV